MPSTDSPAAPDPTLARALTAPGLVCIGLGATIGAGIFVLTGTAAAHYAGPALVLSFVIGGLVSGLVGLCYAELAAMIPQAGSTYAYTRVSLGLLPAWLIGWDLVLEFALAAATVAVGWSGYARSLMADVGLHLPPALCAGPGEGGVVDLPAVGIVLVLTALLTRGVREASWINGALVALKVAIILAFVGLGAAFVSPACGSPSCRRTRASSDISARAGSCAARRWCSSPISGSRPSPRRRGSAGTRRRTRPPA